MPVVNCSPFGPKPQFELTTGLPATGYQVFFYVSGSTSTKQTTYTDSTGTVANTNPLVLNSLGQPATQIWFTAGESYKAVLAPSTDTDPPTSPVWTIDNLRGINDTSVTIDQWVAGPAPTYIGATQFSLVGDQTSLFQVGRRIKATVTAGTVYGRITVSAFAAVTTVTVVLDSGALDSGLSAVSYGLLSATNPSVPAIIDGDSSVTVTFPAGRPTIAVASPIMAGMMFDYAGTAAPSGYLACDGSSVLRATYPNLFTAIGTTWGSVDGTHFNVPDFRRRVAVGSGGSGTGTLGNAVGNTGGAETHTLVVAEIPALTVGITTAVLAATGTTSIQGNNAAVTNNFNTSGGGGAHNNMQPSAVVLKIIKT